MLRNKPSWSLSFTFAFLMAAICAPVFGDVVSATSSGTGLDISVDVLVTGHVSGPTISGTAPGTYNVNDSLGSASSTIGAGGIGITANTGILSVTATSDVDGAPGSRTTTGTATVNNVDINLLTTIFNFDATTIASTADISGDFGSLDTSGSGTVLTNAQFTTFGGGTTNLAANPAPNTMTLVDLDVLGIGAGDIEIWQNEQILAADSITVNAIRLNFDAVDLGAGGIVSGDIIIAQSFAQMTAVPEPGSVLLCLGAMIGLGGWTVRKRRAAKAA